MNAEVIYQKILEKGNKNLTNSNISLDRARAVYLFNEEQNKFVENALKNRGNSSVEDVQILLTTEKISKKKQISNNSVSFKLPEDYFSFSNVEIYASGSGCSSKRISNFQVKPEDVEEFLSDENNKPSFKYEETFYTIENNSLVVYVDNFSVDYIKLKYYRYPKQFNIEGYVDIDNTNSYDSDPEFDDKIVDRIISMCITSFDINNENYNKLQFDINRVNSKL